MCGYLQLVPERHKKSGKAMYLHRAYRVDTWGLQPQQVQQVRNELNALVLIYCSSDSRANAWWCGNVVVAGERSVGLGRQLRRRQEFPGAAQTLQTGDAEMILTVASTVQRLLLYLALVGAAARRLLKPL